MIIEGEPSFEESNLKIEAESRTSSGAVLAGSLIRISAEVSNNGSTGMAPVALYVDGKVVRKQLFPVIRNNRRKIEFEVRIYDAGEHHLAIYGLVGGMAVMALSILVLP